MVVGKRAHLCRFVVSSGSTCVPCIPIGEKEELYQSRYERLLKAIEENQLDFEGNQSKLLSTLEPIQFTADITKLLRDFTGRKWVFDELDAWLQTPSGKKLFWILGEPGVGKSAIAAWVRENRREIAAFHFCDINSEEKRSPAKLVRVHSVPAFYPTTGIRRATCPVATQDHRGRIPGSLHSV